MTSSVTSISIQRQQGYWRGSFGAMASPCEVLVEVGAKKTACKIIEAVAQEAWRIEARFSRYRDDNIIHRINHSQGKEVILDEETARMIDFAAQLFDMSDGLFDITSGVLRKLWNFNGSDVLPEQSQIDDLLPHIGWQKVRWNNPALTMPDGMQIDLGGIGKEYAVDRCVQIAASQTNASVLINFGGDLASTAARKNDRAWSVGRLVTGKDQASGIFHLKKGAIATSGDANRFLLKDGIRYSHILNPQTGWPVTDAPHTISVAAPTCTEAGMISTLALLQGAQAEDFLKLQQVNYWLD